jgi:hypothetical protein
MRLTNESWAVRKVLEPLDSRLLGTRTDTTKKSDSLF